MEAAAGERLTPTRAEQTLAASVQSLPGLSVMVFDTEGRVLSLHGGAPSRHGYEPDRLIGRLLTDIFPADQLPFIGSLCAQVLEGAELVLDRRSIDGTAIYEWTVGPVREDGEVIGGTLIAREVTELREAQCALTDTARQFQAFAETSVDGHCRYTADGTLLWTSPSMSTVLGRPMADLIGTRAEMEIHPEDQVQRGEIIADMLANREPRAREFRGRHGDGTWHWFESTVRGWFDEEGALLEVHVTTRDVGARRADEELRRQWQLSFDMTRRGIVVTDAQTNLIQRVNAAYATMHGGVPDDFVGLPVLDTLSERAAERIIGPGAVIAEDGYLHYVTEHVGLDGRVFPVDTEVVAARGADGRMVYRVSYIEDLTEERRRDASERQAVALFEASLDQAPIGMCLVGPDGGFLRVNDALCRLFKRSERELLALDFQALTHPDDLGADLTLLQETLAGERAGYEIDKRYLTPAGEVIETQLSVSLIRDVEGCPAYFVSQIVDLTERSRLEDQLQASLRITNVLLAEGDSDPLGPIAREARVIARSDTAAVLLPTGDPAFLRMAVAVGEGTEGLIGMLVPVEGSVSAEVLATGLPRLLDGLAARTVAGNVQVAAGADTGPEMVVPLLGEGGPRGTLVLNRLQGREVFEAGDLKLATAFANQAAVALELADARERAQQVELLKDRDRIARDLHDHVIQRLFAAGLTLQSLAGAVGDGPHGQRLDRAIEDIDETITQIRSAIYGLRTPLGPAMSSGRDRILAVLAQLSPLLPAEPAVQFTGPLDVMVPDEIYDDVVAVLREALTNVARHAHARRVEVTVSALVASREMLVQVSDDGVGLGPVGRRSGLANLRKRAENRAGTFTVESPVAGSDVGTRLRWVVPL